MSDTVQTNAVRISNLESNYFDLSVRVTSVEYDTSLLNGFRTSTEAFTTEANLNLIQLFDRMVTVENRSSNNAWRLGVIESGLNIIDTLIDGRIENFIFDLSEYDRQLAAHQIFIDNQLTAVFDEIAEANQKYEETRTYIDDTVEEAIQLLGEQVYGSLTALEGQINLDLSTVENNFQTSLSTLAGTVQTDQFAISLKVDKVEASLLSPGFVRQTDGVSKSGEPTIGEWVGLSDQPESVFVTIPGSNSISNRALRFFNGWSYEPPYYTGPSIKDKVFRIRGWVFVTPGATCRIGAVGSFLGSGPGGTTVLGQTTAISTDGGWVEIDRSFMVQVDTDEWAPAILVTGGAEAFAQVWRLRFEDDAVAGSSEFQELTASVLTQQAAIVDLEGNASAGYLIKAQAGDSVSLLDLVAADGTAGSVSVAKISANNIILDGTVSAPHLAANAVTANSILAGSVTTAALDTGSVTAIKISSGAVIAEKIAAGAILADKIAANAILSSAISAGAVTANKIAANTILASNINTGSFSASGLALFDGTLQSTNFVSGVNGTGWRILNNGNAEFGTLALRDNAVSTFRSVTGAANIIGTVATLTFTPTNARELNVWVSMLMSISTGTGSGEAGGSGSATVTVSVSWRGTVLQSYTVASGDFFGSVNPGFVLSITNPGTTSGTLEVSITVTTSAPGTASVGHPGCNLVVGEVRR
jgi:hypothetical protein